MKENLENEYFEWLCMQINTRMYPSRKFSRLLLELYSTDYRYTFPMDDNRYQDGVDLRYRYGQELGVSQAMIARVLDGKPCSVLEMMVALAIRVEEHIMADPEYGDRTGRWFWEFIDNLGLIEQTDNNYKPNKVYFALGKFMDRRFNYDGTDGNIIVVREPFNDLREVEIWYQMMWHLNEIED